MPVIAMELQYNFLGGDDQIPPRTGRIIFEPKPADDSVVTPSPKRATPTRAKKAAANNDETALVLASQPAVETRPHTVQRRTKQATPVPANVTTDTKVKQVRSETATHYKIVSTKVTTVSETVLIPKGGDFEVPQIKAPRKPRVKKIPENQIEGSAPTVVVVEAAAAAPKRRGRPPKNLKVVETMI